MWCLCHFQLKPWKLPAYQRGLRCMAGSLWSPWKSKPEVGRATHPIKGRTYCEEGNKARPRSNVLISSCGFRPAPVWLPSEAAGQRVWLQVAALETACLPRISILPPLRAEEHECTEILANLKDLVCQGIRFINYSGLTSSNFFVLARSHTWFNIRIRLLRPQSGWSSCNQMIISAQNITLVCLYVWGFFSTHLDNVRRNDKLWWSAVALFIWRSWRSQSKDPLHLVPETLFAWLLVHCWINVESQSCMNFSTWKKHLSFRKSVIVQQNHTGLLQNTYKIMQPSKHTGKYRFFEHLRAAVEFSVRLIGCKYVQWPCLENLLPCGVDRPRGKSSAQTATVQMGIDNSARWSPTTGNYIHNHLTTQTR